MIESPPPPPPIYSERDDDDHEHHHHHNAPTTPIKALPLFVIALILLITFKNKLK